MSESKRRSAIHSFDIDNYLNYFVVRPRWNLLPQPVTYLFGYRKPSQPDGSSPLPPSVLLNWLFSWIGAFCGIAIIENVFRALPLLGGHQAPLVIASFGAAAILEYNTISSPLSQPRNLIFGHFLSAVIGVSITKLVHLLPEARFQELRWVAGALSVATASTVMSITKTVHPPAGATALLAATTPEITALGWWLLPLVLLASMLMLVSAMIINNVYTRFPLYWWTPADLSKFKWGQDDGDIVKVSQAEQGKSDQSSSASESTYGAAVEKKVGRHPSDVTSGRLSSDAVTVGHHDVEEYDSVERKKQRNIHDNAELRIQIEVERIVVPDWMTLSQWEVEVLEGFQTKLRSATAQ